MAKYSGATRRAPKCSSVRLRKPARQVSKPPARLQPALSRAPRAPRRMFARHFWRLAAPPRLSGQARRSEPTAAAKLTTLESNFTMMRTTDKRSTFVCTPREPLYWLARLPLGQPLRRPAHNEIFNCLLMASRRRRTRIVSQRRPSRRVAPPHLARVRGKLSQPLRLLEQAHCAPNWPAP